MRGHAFSTRANPTPPREKGFSNGMIDVVMGNSTFFVVMAAGLVACAITTVGIWLVSRYEEWVKRHAIYFVSFAAGVLLTISLSHVVPVSLQRSELAPLFLLAGFLGLYLLNRFLSLHEHGAGESKSLVSGLVPIMGIGFHSFIDGVIYSVTFNVSIFTGALTAFGTILHEFPEGIITFALLKRSGYSLRKSILYAFLAAALTTPLGVLVSYPFLRQISDRALGSLLALSAGALIYVGATHLLPNVEDEEKPYTVIPLLAGVVIGILIIWTKNGFG